MNTDPSNNASHFYALSRQQANGPASKPVPSQQNAGDPETVSINKYAGKLKSEPEIRPEVVAKGRELLNDPNFPSKEVVDAIAKLVVPFADGD